jgi:hypothetical protein
LLISQLDDMLKWIQFQLKRGVGPNGQTLLSQQRWRDMMSTSTVRCLQLGLLLARRFFAHPFCRFGLAVQPLQMDQHSTNDAQRQLGDFLKGDGCELCVSAACFHLNAFSSFTSYGLGWGAGMYRNHRRNAHGGETSGFRAMVWPPSGFDLQLKLACLRPRCSLRTASA